MTRSNSFEQLYSSIFTTSFSDAPLGVDLDVFTPVTVSDVTRVFNRLLNKTSAADPIPTSVLKEVSDLVVPFLTELFNRSLLAGYYPAEFKHASITRIVKNAGLNAASASLYRPISNVLVLSKMFERVVARQLGGYPQHNQLFIL
jgi:hypothetical protein